MIADDELVMMSALQHYCFCPRQCALIHVEEVWRDNDLTASGRLLHERVDRRGSESRGDVKTLTALRLVSRRLGVTGVADGREPNVSEIVASVKECNSLNRVRYNPESGLWRRETIHSMLWRWL